MLDLDPAAIQSIDSADEVRGALADRVRAVVQSADGVPQRVRVQVPVPEPVRPIDWIRAQAQSEAVYWSGRRDDRAVAAVGAADVVASEEAPVVYDELGDRLSSRLREASASARYYGGLRFDAAQSPAADRPDGRWAPFGTYRFVLPRFELVETGQDLSLACNLVLPRDGSRGRALARAVDRIALPAPKEPSPLPQPFHRRDVPDRGQWTDMVRWALQAIDADALDKVVLARRVALNLAESMDPLLVLRHLESATPGCYHFGIRPQNGLAFVGASPERLFRREGATVVSEAVAGTRPRGDTPTEDAALREELLESPKERREHAFVQEAIRSALEAVCTSVQTPDDVGELVLARDRHLCSEIRGTLRPDTPTTDLLKELHPTPAVGGVPTEDAVSAIRTQEPFDRGWYAGPVGWVGQEAAEFAVGLRAGLVWDDRIALFSGAGIVEGSEPGREWEEIEQKIGDFAAIMGVVES